MKKIFTRLIVAAVIALANPYCAAFCQMPCKIEHYSTEDGLSHDVVTSIFKDSQGCMWFGTWDGINRFDGHRFIAFKSAAGDSSQLKNDRIDQITEDQFNHLWLKGYDGEIYRFDKTTFKFRSLSAILNLHDKTSFDRILSTDNGMLWVRTIGRGIICLPKAGTNPDEYVRYQTSSVANCRLPSNKVNFFYRDHNGAIWLGTNCGLACLVKNNYGKYTNRLLDNSQQAYNVVSFAEYADKLFFGTTKGKLLVYDKRHRSFTDLTLSQAALNSVAVAHKAPVLYLATQAGELISLNIYTLQTSRVLSPGHTPLHGIFEDHEGDLWLKPDKTGIIRYSITGTFFTYAQKTDSKYISQADHYKVFEDKHGNVWCVLRDGGFGYFNRNTNKLEYFYNEPGSRDHHFSNLANVVFYDPNGLMWLHTDERGIEKVIFQTNEFAEHLLINPGIFKSQNEVRAMYADGQNRLWVGGKNGRVYLFKNGVQVQNVFTNEPAGGIGAAYAIIEDHNGALWFGTKTNGLFKAVPTDASRQHYTLSHFEHTTTNSVPPFDDEIYALSEDRSGNIWLGTFRSGLYVISNKNATETFTHISAGYCGYPQRFDKIRKIVNDFKGRIWIGTTDGLVVANYNSDKHYKFTTYSKQPGDIHSLGNNDIQFIHCSAAGSMWLATSGGGLSLAIEDTQTDKLIFKSYTTKNGLANDYVLSCGEDAANYLWVATKGGLSRFDTKTGQFKNYNSYDGVPNFGFSEATCQTTADGKMAFGTLHGYLLFDPQQIKNYPIHANILFTNLQVNNKDVNVNDSTHVIQHDINYAKAITLKHNQNIFSIDYTLLDYRAGNNQNFKYRLLGFDNEWHYNRNLFRATYTNLPAGHFVFEVKSADQDRYLSLPYRQLDITVLPAPWATWWAYLIYALVLAGIFAVIGRTTVAMLRLKHKMAIEKRLTELKLSFFTNISHELRTPLTLIINPIEQIFKKETLTQPGLDSIAIVQRNANRMIRFVNQLLDFRKVQNGKATLHCSMVEIVSFTKNISAYFDEIRKEKQISFAINAEQNEINLWIDPDKMETVIYNLIGNAFKFTPPGRGITVNIFKDGVLEQLIIEVADEGCGIMPEDLENIFELYHEGAHPQAEGLKGTGIGLALAKELITLHQGEIVAQNREKEGLSVLIKLPMIDHPEHIVHHTSPADKYPPIIDLPISEMLREPCTTDIDAETPLLLLVEDNNDMRDFLYLQLSTVYRVETAADGLEGLKKIKKRLPDIVLSDIMMPLMDGIQLLQELKNDETTSHIPVILLSARNAIESQVSGLKYGADYYITKPFDNEFLLAAINNILRQRKKLFEGMVSGKKLMSLNPGEIVVTSKDEVFLKKVINIIEEKMADPDFNIDIVAGMINMARPTFFKKFKSLTQIAPVEFVRDIRLKRAQQYLDAGNNNVTEIAYMVGFSSQKYFSTCFRAKYHLTPTEYLRKVKPLEVEIDEGK